MTRKAPPGASLWRAQLGALGLDVEAQAEPWARAEALRLRSVRLPELAVLAQPLQAQALPVQALPVQALPVRAVPAPARAASGSGRWRRHARWAGAAATAVLLFLAWAPRPAGTDRRAKGAGQVTVFWERAGRVQHLGDGGALAEGDRVRADVQAPADGFAYWLVADAQGRALVDSAFVAGSALHVRAGVASAFAQSLRLTGEPADETLLVLVCAGPDPTRTVLDGLAPAVGEVLVLANVPAACTVSSFKLR